MADDDRLAGLERAGGFGRRPRLAHKLLEHVMLAPVRTPHAGEGGGDDAAPGDEERRDKTPPVGVCGAAVQKHQPRRAPLAPGEDLDLRPLDLDEGPLRLVSQDRVKPSRRRRLMPMIGRQRRHVLWIGHKRFPFRRRPSLLVT